MNGALFVWVWGMRGPEPEIWRTPGVATSRKIKLAEHPLTEGEAKWPIAALVGKYPAPLQETVA